MHRKSLLVVLIGAIALGTVSASALALPDDRFVTFDLREVPTDPDSDIVFTIELELQASETDGDWIGWEITRASFTEPGTGNPDTHWSKQSPEVGTQDGLWWVEHNEPQKPVSSEFVMPPLLEGTATAKDPLDDDLEYSLEGVEYQGTPVFDITAAMDYEFTLEGKQTPFKTGTGEVVDTDGGSEDPD